MKPVAVFYATREGQTQRIAEHVAASLCQRGLEATVYDVRAQPAVKLGQYAAAVVAGSVHAGRHEAELVRFVKEHIAALDNLPSAFLSVTRYSSAPSRSSGCPRPSALITAFPLPARTPCSA